MINLSLKTKHLRRYNNKQIEQRKGISSWDFLEPSEISNFYNEIEGKI